MDLTADTVNGFLAEHATDTHLENLRPAISKRRTALDTIRVTSFKVGDEVIVDKIRPKYLAQLRGTLLEISPLRRGARQGTVIRLDEESTNRLRKHQYIPDEDIRHEIDIIPLNACYPTGDGNTAPAR